MDRDPIYAAREITERVEVEAVRLLDNFKGQMAYKGFLLGKSHTDDDDSEDHNTCWFWAEAYSLERIGKSRKRRAISLLFDLYRLPSSAPDEWPHAREALLTIAYGATGFEDWWTASHIAIEADGCCEAYKDGTLSVFESEPRLLVDTREETSWMDKSWLYSVPLRAISSADALTRGVITPMEISLVRNEAKLALVGTNAVTWPSIQLQQDGEGAALSRSRG